MRTVSLFVNACLLSLALLISMSTFGQAGILNPADPIVNYDAVNNPTPAQPPNGQMAKWVRTPRLGWETSSFKSYIYKGLAFRLKFPKTYQHQVADGKTYPVFIFFHGIGERGTIYDNEYQLYHGGEVHRNAVDQGKFDGFLLYAQASAPNGYFSTAQLGIIAEIVQNYLIPQVKADINRIMVDGLSGGGVSSWTFMMNYPKLVAAGLPISAPIGIASPTDNIPNLKFTPIWQFQGGLDEAPYPASTEGIVNNYRNAGADFSYTLYPDQGHGCWYSAWAEPNFYPFMNKAHKANPTVLFQRTEFCPGDPINVTMGVTPGFDGYQWKKGADSLLSETGNQITVTGPGVYSCRILRGSEWSVWSPIPANITIKAPTVSPTITTVGTVSNVIPALDGATSVPLQVPAGYNTYSWVKEGSATVLSTVRTLSATSAGDYKVKVTELFGCSSDFTAPFKVIPAAGPNGPDAATNLMVSTVSKTELRLDWVDNPNPAFDETAFEIYQATQSSGPYVFKGTVPANTYTYTQSALTANTRYYYKVRAINATAASAASNIANGVTLADNSGPTAPSNLIVTSSNRNSISLKWNRSVDDVSVSTYEFFINGQLSFNTTDTFYTAANLTAGQTYNFTVRARDGANNVSPFSNQVTWQPVFGALPYKYYTFTGTWNNLPDYGTLTPVSTGTMANVRLTPRTQDDNFSFLWEGIINITVAGDYTFRTGSDDGSKMWFNPTGTNSPYSFAGTPFVANDGLHGTNYVNSAQVHLEPGAYGVAFAFYEQGGGEAMNVDWITPQTNGNWSSIPDSAFRERPVYPGLAPKAPATLTATAVSYSRINLTWIDSSDNETGFEIWRSTNATTGFTIIKTATANTVSYGDSSLLGNTRYYYKVRAIGQYGESAYDRASSFVNALTLPLPPIPAAPSGLIAGAVSSTRIIVNWTDNATTETKYELYRSGNTNTNYLLYATLPANSNSFTDAGLYPNTTFYYKVRAVNDGGNTAFSNEDSALTRGAAPVITDIDNQYIQYGTVVQVPVSASSNEPGPLVITSVNLPAFAVYNSTGNGTGKLVLSPTAAQVGTYPGVQLIVTDQVGGKDTTTFSIEVNNNVRPVIGAVGNVSVREHDTLLVNISATDADNSGAFNWTFINLPEFATAVTNNDQVALTLTPGYADNGVYRVQARVNDGSNGIDTLSFNITVQDINPVQSVSVSFTDGTYMAPAPWNNTGKIPAINDFFPALLDQTGAASPVGLRLLTSWTGVNNQGVNTGNNSGIYPDAVLRSSYYTNSTRRLRFTGLTVGAKYDFTFLGSRANPTAGVGVATNYSVGSETVLLNSANNSTQTVKILNQLPNTAGEITVTVVNAPGAVYGYLNSIVISSVYEDNNPPAKPRNLTASTGNNRVTLNWIDAAYNETAYEVYRAQTRSGVYTLLNPAGNNPNISTYADSTVVPNTPYFYAVRAVNGFGASAYSDTVSTQTDNSPVIDSIPDVILSVNQSYTVRIAAFDAGDVVTLSAANLPAFATFTDLGHGVGTIDIHADTTRGLFSHVKVIATDEHGNSSNREFSITIDRANLTRAYVNFNQIFPAPAPWNNTNAAPAATMVLNSLKDQFNATTPMNVNLMENWTAASTTGAVTGNNSGVFPDDVMKTYYYYTGTTERQVRLSGLDTTKQYDLTFFGSRVSTSGTIITRYASAGSSVTLDAANNTSQTVKLAGLRPDSSGVIIFTVVKDTLTASSGGYLNALVIEGYPKIVTQVAAPAKLAAYGLTSDKIRLTWDSVRLVSGYEIWRSTSSQSGFTKVADLAPATRVLTDSLLSASTIYYYKVRAALTAGGFTAFSTYVAASTLQFTVKLNLNDGSAASPAEGNNWNNTNALITDGFQLNNMVNSNGNATGINWSVVKNFSGYNTLGAVTGDNSGVFPDNVMKTFFYTNAGDSARIRVSGLNQSNTYTFVFFGSRANPSVSVVTAYKIGTRSVTLNAANNKTLTVQIENVKPNADGTVDIVIRGAANNLGYLNAMLIQASVSYGETNIYARGISASGNDSSSVTPPAVTGRSAVQPETAAAPAVTGLVTYPNPFRDDLTVKFDLKENVRNFTIRLTDLGGNTVFSQAFGETAKGPWQKKLGVRGGTLAPGTYIVQVEGLPGQKIVSGKVIKSPSRR